MNVNLFGCCGGHGSGIGCASSEKSRQIGISSSQATLNENDYFASTNSAAWEEADYDCIRLFNNNSGLVNIDSEFENTELIKLLENYGSGSYWTGGLYFSREEVFVWLRTMTRLPTEEEWSYNPWASGEPTSDPSTHTRTLLNHQNQFQSEWSTGSSLMSKRYICERENSNLAPIVPCYTEVDLDIVLDSSGIIGSRNFLKALDFVSRLAAAFIPYASSRIGFVTYSDGVSRILHIDNGMTPQQIRNAILAMQYTSGGTNTHLGIDSAAAELTSKRRSGVTSNMLVITDGQSNDPQAIVNAANNALALGIRSFVVGISANITAIVMEEIVGGVQERIFRTDKWEHLFGLIPACSKAICTK